MKAFKYNGNKHVWVRQEGMNIYLQKKGIEDILNTTFCVEDNFILMSEWYGVLSTDPVFFQWLLEQIDILKQNYFIQKELEYQNKIQNIQYLETENKNNNVIKLKDRIVFLKYIPNNHFEKFYKPRHIKDIPVEHPNRNNVHAKLMKLSKVLNSKKKQHHNCYAVINRKGRSNMYTLKDYEDFGDNVIHEFFKRHPYSEWGVNPERTPESEIIEYLKLCKL